MSCNGCRVLRKGCSDDCTIRPCLQWIKSPDSQANATMFLAKFYGRAGLLNLINSGPDHLRPAIFRSLLYEACGRIINPIYGSVGLLWSGNWAQCQSAVEGVLKGTSQFMQYPSSDGRASIQLPPGQPLRNSCDIRHIKKLGSGDSNTEDLHKVRTRTRFKRSKPDSADPDSKPGAWIYPAPIYEETSHRDSTEDGSMFSVETVEVTQIQGGRILSTSGSKTEQIWKFDNPVAEAEEAGEMPSPDDHQESEAEVGLELTLG